VSAAGGPKQDVRLGFALGTLGVLAFSLTLPMTRLAVAQLDAAFVAFARMSIAGVISAGWLLATRAPLPHGDQWWHLAGASFGVVFGFPLLSSFAMRTVDSSHGAVVNGLMPFATALFAAWLHGDRQGRRFWAWAVIGSAIVVAFALRAGNLSLSAGDVWMLGAVVTGSLGYVVGARLSAKIGGIRVILWALVIGLPVSLPFAVWLAAVHPPQADAPAWMGLAYVTLVSQLVAFFAWYNGLSLGGIARVGQIQLLQVFFTIAFAAAVFGERVEPVTWLAAVAVVACIVLGRSGGRQ
jgi:drug/metabolite transporter (DMT)-like permease